MYAKIENSVVVAYPYALPELRRDFPNTSFPSPMTDAEYATYSVYPVAPRNPPPFNQVTQNCTRVDPTFEDGAWVETWSVTDASPEEITQRTNEKASEVRAQRNMLLAQCDWTMLPDAPVLQDAWASYRQQLRDISSQPGFPVDIAWPTPPTF